MSRPTITQTNGKFPRHALADAQAQEDVVNNLNEHAAALDALGAPTDGTGRLTVASTTPITITATLTEAAAGTTADNIHTAVKSVSAGTVSADFQTAIPVFAQANTKGANGHLVSQNSVYGEANGDATVRQSVGLYGYGQGGVLSIGTAGDADTNGGTVSYPLLARGAGGLALFSDYNWTATPPIQLSIANGLAFNGTVKWLSGSGSPEGAVTAAVGSLYTRTNGGAGTTLYVKESGSGNTGWVSK